MKVHPYFQAGITRWTNITHPPWYHERISTLTDTYYKEYQLEFLEPTEEDIRKRKQRELGVVSSRFRSGLITKDEARGYVGLGTIIS